MENFILFRQMICLLLFFDFIFLLPNFYTFFGKENFKRSWIDTPVKGYALAAVILVDLVLLFFNIYPLLTSFILTLSLRYCYITNYIKRLLQGAGAVGHICYFISVYLFLFELGKAVDPELLSEFFHEVFAFEIGLLMVMAGLYKGFLGYMRNEGVEYGLVNPMWGKFYKFFKEVPPNSWIYQVNNWIAFLGEALTGLLFFIPESRILGVVLLFGIFLFILATIKVGVLPLMMMGSMILYLPSIPFHFLQATVKLPIDLYAPALTPWIKGLFIGYLVLLVIAYIVLLLKHIWEIKIPWVLQKIIDYRPVFQWGVFTKSVTDYVVTIETISKETGETIELIFDGVGIHHHHSSMLMSMFGLEKFHQIEGNTSTFYGKMVAHAKTLQPKMLVNDFAYKYHLYEIVKTEKGFDYQPLASFAVDIQSDRVIRLDRM